MLSKCTDMTLHGRCRQTVTYDVVDGEVVPLKVCYYHNKLRNGLLTSADAINLIDEEEEE